MIIFWGITASQQCDCGTAGFDTVSYTGEVAKYLGDVHVIGVNSTGTRHHGRFLPSVYCGGSAYAVPPEVQMAEPIESFKELVLFHINKDVLWP
ncbi:MAG: hypothetical protein WCF65_01030 [Parachlamydiaceae bacterium]